MSYLKPLYFRDLFDSKRVVSSSNPIDTNFRNDNKTSYNSDGIFSEQIFGPEADSNNQDTIGWIDFKNIYIINPLYYERIVYLIRKNVLLSIINYEKKITADGHIIPEEDIPDDGKKRKKIVIPEENMGLIEFKRNFIKIIQKYTSPAKKESSTYRIVMEAYFKNLIFIDCFPIISPKLRPGQLNKAEKVFRFSEINNHYNFIIAHSNEIKKLLANNEFDDIKLQVLDIMYRLQEDCNNVVDSIINDHLKNKSGVFRKIIAAGRLNFSARNVITPEPYNRVNEVSMNYRTFSILYEELLINLVHRTKKISYNESSLFVKNHQNVFSEELYSYMTELVNKTPGGMHIILNRNPSISLSSIHLVTIKNVKRDITDIVLGLSNNILAGMGAKLQNWHHMVVISY